MFLPSSGVAPQCRHAFDAPDGATSMLPSYWLEFIQSNALDCCSASVPEDADESTAGVEMKFLDSEQSHDELTRFWPGIGVAKDGFVPVAECSIGSGDYYYINSHDGPGGPLYRIYHDAVHAEGYDRSEAVATVFSSYDALLRYVESRG
jgi:hypothetical protein